MNDPSTWPHPTIGTCVKGCEFYGLCHCGCGEDTTFEPYTIRMYQVLGGNPRIFRVGHYRRVQGQLPKRWTAKGVPREKYEQLVLFLVDYHGSYRAAAKAAGLPASTLRAAAVRYQIMTPRTALCIVGAIEKIRASALDPKSIERHHDRNHRDDPDPMCEYCQKRREHETHHVRVKESLRVIRFPDCGRCNCFQPNPKKVSV